MARTFIKQWLNYPTRGVTYIGIFHPYMLKVKQFYHIYLEGHAGNFALMRLKGDNIVNKCIDSKLDREKQWKKKKINSGEVQQNYENLVTNHVIRPTSQGSTSKRTITKAKKEVKKSVQNEVKDKRDKKSPKTRNARKLYTTSYRRKGKCYMAKYREKNAKEHYGICHKIRN